MLNETMLSDEKIIVYLVNLGLTKYEAKIYLALLRNKLSYGSEIQKVSGVPGPKVYETISLLITKGIVYPRGTNPTRYEPLPLKEFLRTKEKEFSRITKDLYQLEDNITQTIDPVWLWQLKGYENVLDKAKELINQSHKYLTISLWYEDGLKLENELKEANIRGVEINSVQMGCEILNVGKFCRHIMLPVVYERHGSEFILVVDGSRGIFMVRNQLGEIEGYYTSNSGLIRMIENYVRHDIFLNRAICDSREEMFKRYGDNLKGLLTL